jgi:hypothetical protein
MPLAIACEDEVDVGAARGEVAKHGTMDREQRSAVDDPLGDFRLVCTSSDTDIGRCRASNCRNGIEKHHTHRRYNELVTG